MTTFEQSIYKVLSESYGISARDIARALGVTRKEVNHQVTYGDIAGVCKKIDENHWVVVEDSERPHIHMKSACTYYSSVADFQNIEYSEWFDLMKNGYSRMHRPFGNGRGLFQSMKDTFDTMQKTFKKLGNTLENSEIFFEFNSVTQGRGRFIDVMVITGKTAFIMEFKMLNTVLPKYIDQTVKYVPDMKEYFRGQGMTVVPILVLTKAKDFYEVIDVKGRVKNISACSGDKLAKVIKSSLQ